MTGKSKARFVSKKIFTFDQFRDNVQGYLLTELEAAFSKNFPVPGFVGALPPVARTSSSVISIGATGGPFYAFDGAGHVVTFSNADFPSLSLPPGLPDSTELHVGLELALLDQGVEVNPRTQKVNYRKQTDAIGRMRTPTAVVDNGDGTLTFTVDSVAAAGINHSGRTVTVWLKALEDGGGVGPQSPVEAVAIETRTIAYVGGHNVITTVGKMGQGVASVVPGDYIAVLNGPTVTNVATESLYQVPGVVLVTTTLAIGGDAAAIIDSSLQTQLFSQGDLAAVFARGVHGGLKVAVQADAADTHVSQIKVISPFAETVFTVDERGEYEGKQSARWSRFDEEWQYSDLSAVGGKWLNTGGGSFAGGLAYPGMADPGNYPTPFLDFGPVSSPNSEMIWYYCRGIFAMDPSTELTFAWEWAFQNLTTDWDSVGVGLAGAPALSAAVTDCIWMKADLTAAGAMSAEARAGGVATVAALASTSIPSGAVPTQQCKIVVHGNSTPEGQFGGAAYRAKFYIGNLLMATISTNVPSLTSLRPFMFAKMTNGGSNNMFVGPIKASIRRY